jgi:hypothetical protein
MRRASWRQEAIASDYDSSSNIKSKLGGKQRSVDGENLNWETLKTHFGEYTETTTSDGRPAMEADDFKMLLGSVFLGAKDERLHGLFDACDADGDGLVTWDELLDYMTEGKGWQPKATSRKRGSTKTAYGSGDAESTSREGPVRQPCACSVRLPRRAAFAGIVACRFRKT